MVKPTVLFITKDFSQQVERSSYYLSLELAKQTHLLTWSEHGDIQEILKALPRKPDFILLNDFKPDYCPFIRNLRQSPIPYGIIMHDLKYKIPQRKRFIEQENVQHIFGIYRDSFLKWYPDFADRFVWLPHHVPLDIFKDYGLDKSIDILMTGAIHPHIYPVRHQMYQAFKEHENFRYIEHPGYTTVNKNKDGIYVGEKYARLINLAKIFLTCDSVEKFPVLKYYEALACNTLLVATESKELNDLGFVDGQTMITVTENNLEEKVRYYLKHEDERQAIANRGLKMVKRNHSTEKRAKDLVDAIKKIIKLHRHD